MLANETWEQIGSHLDNLSYHNVRLSSTQINLPILQTITYPVYQQLLIKKHHAHYVSVQPSFYSTDYMEFLITFKQYDNILRFLKSNRSVSMDALWNISDPPSYYIKELYRMVGTSKSTKRIAWVWMCTFELMDLIHEMANVPTSYLEIGLGIACEKGHLNLVLYLLETAVNPGYDDNYAFIQACRNGHVDIVKILLQDGRIDPAEDDQQAFFEAVAEGHLDVLEILLQDARIDPSLDDNDLFISCCREGNLKAAKMLFQDPRVDPSDNFNQAIVDASANGHVEIVQMLLQDHRVDPSDSTTGFIDDNEPLIQACSFGHEDVVRVLLRDPRVNPGACEHQALYYACKRGYEVIVELLMDHSKFEWDLNITNAFEEACDNNHWLVVKLFVERNVLKKYDIKSGLQVAVKSGGTDVVAFLMDFIDPSENDNEILELAMEHGAIRTVRVLLLDARVRKLGGERVQEWLEAFQERDTSEEESEEDE